MSVSNTVVQQSFSGNGVTTNFAIPFAFHANTQVKVKTISSSGTVTYWTEGVEYTITGGDPGTTVVAGTAPASGVTLVIYRQTSLIQAYDLLNNTVVNLETIEKAMDYIIFTVQEQAYNLTQSGIFGFYAQTTQSVSASGTISIDETKQRLIVPVQGTPGAVTTSATTAVENGTINGQELLIRGAHATYSVTIPGGASNMELNGDMVLVAQSHISLVWNSTTSKWTEVARSN